MDPLTQGTLGATLAQTAARPGKIRAYAIAGAVAGLAPDLDPSPEGVEALRARIRAAGCATADGEFIPGLVAIAAPVLDWQGEAQCAVTLIGTEREATQEGAATRAALLRFCADRSVTGPEGEGEAG